MLLKNGFVGQKFRAKQSFITSLSENSMFLLVKTQQSRIC